MRPMKLSLRKAFVFCLLLPMVVQAQDKHFTLKATLGNVPATATAYLVYKPMDDTKIDSVKAENGVFTFKGNIAQVTSAYLLLSPYGDGLRGKDYSELQLYLEPRNILVNSPDRLVEAKVEAGQVNSDHAAIKVLLKPISSTEKKLRTAFQTAVNDQKKVIELQLEQCEAQRKGVYQDFIARHPDHLMSFFALKAKAGSVPKVEELEPYFNLLSPEIKASKDGLAYAAYLANLKVVALRAMAPAFTLPDTSGKMVSLSGYRGKYVLVDFWASWCKPCREENPNLLRAHQRYKDKGLVIIGISLDYPGGRKAWIEAIKKDKMEWIQLSELKGWEGKTGKAYLVKAIPQNFLLDPHGRIVAKDLRGPALQKKLEEIYH